MKTFYVCFTSDILNSDTCLSVHFVYYVLKMRQRKCSYYKCTKATQDHRVFGFPINDPVRLNRWIENSGNPVLKSFTKHELKSKFICAKHFPASSVNQGHCKILLIGPAVPFPYQESIETEDVDQNMEKDVSPLPSELKMVMSLLTSEFYKQTGKKPSLDFIGSSPSISSSTKTVLVSSSQKIDWVPSHPDTVLEKSTQDRVLTRSPQNTILVPSPQDTVLEPSPQNTVLEPSPQKTVLVPSSKELTMKCDFERGLRYRGRYMIPDKDDSPLVKYLKSIGEKRRKTIRTLNAKIRRLNVKVRKLEEEKNKEDNTPSGILVAMQKRNLCQKKPWSEAEKQLCLSIYEKSPAAYKFLLNQGIVLASWRTVNTWLNKSKPLDLRTLVGTEGDSSPERT